MSRNLVILVGFVGSGKSDVATYFELWKLKGIISNCVCLHELDEKYGGKRVKEVVKSKASPLEKAEIYWQHRFELLESIISPLIQDGNDVIVEHGFVTTFVYQYMITGLIRDKRALDLFWNNVERFVRRLDAKIHVITLDRELNKAFDDGKSEREIKDAFLNAPKHFAERFPEILFHSPFSQTDYPRRGVAPTIAACHIAMSILGHDISR